MYSVCPSVRRGRYDILQLKINGGFFHDSWPFSIYSITYLLRRSVCNAKDFNWNLIRFSRLVLKIKICYISYLVRISVCNDLGTSNLYSRMYFFKDKRLEFLLQIPVINKSIFFYNRTCLYVFFGLFCAAYGCCHPCLDYFLLIFWSKFIFLDRKHETN